jgi:hypothetical protein
MSHKLLGACFIATTMIGNLSHAAGNGFWDSIFQVMFWNIGSIVITLYFVYDKKTDP